MSDRSGPGLARTRRSILVADADPLSRRSLGDLLRTFIDDVDVEEVDTAETCFGCLRGRAIDVLVATDDLPDAEFEPFLSKLGEGMRPRGVVLVTGRTDVSVHEATRLGADACVPSPIDPQALVDEVTRLLP